MGIFTIKILRSNCNWCIPVPVISIFTKLDTELVRHAATSKGHQSLRKVLDSSLQKHDRVDSCIQRLKNTTHPPAGIVKLKGVSLSSCSVD